MVANGNVPHYEKNGNDKADNAADKGAMKEDERLNCVAYKYSDKQRMYGDLMMKIQKIIFAMRETERQMRGNNKIATTPLKNPDTETMLIPMQFCSAMRAPIWMSAPLHQPPTWLPTHR